MRGGFEDVALVGEGEVGFIEGGERVFAQVPAFPRLDLEGVARRVVPVWANERRAIVARGVGRSLDPGRLS